MDRSVPTDRSARWVPEVRSARRARLGRTVHSGRTVPLAHWAPEVRSARRARWAQMAH